MPCPDEDMITYEEDCEAAYNELNIDEVYVGAD
jgi:hypothetical protein